jgi:hypothetical protein
MAELPDDAQTRLALAALAASLVKALDGRWPGLGEDFVSNLSHSYQQVTDVDVTSVGLLEALKWTSEFYRDLR